MKIVLIIASSFLIVPSHLFSQIKKAETYLEFKQNGHDFGKIKQGSVVNFDFLFDNISEEYVTIESVTAPCGCMIPYKPETAVAKGKSEKVRVEFTAGKPGPFKKVITVKLEGIEKPLTVTITGEVLDHENWLVYEKNLGTKTETEQ